MSVTVDIIESPGLGDRSYLVHDGTSAFVVDPPRDIDRVLDRMEHHGVRIEKIFETHLHNDYVSGGLALHRRTDAPIVASADDEHSFEVDAVGDGDIIAVGRMEIEVRHTPGHTHSHLSYITRVAGEVCAVFTGGSLLYGTVGRTDLLGEDQTDELTRRQWESVRGLVADLPDDTEVYPTHGFGSFCSAKAGDDRTSGTIADEHDNPAVATDEVDEFVAELRAGLTDVPAYYAHMAHLNRAGMAEPDLSPVAEVDIEELVDRLDAGEWVVDLRRRRTFAHRHLVGSFNFEADGLPTHLGWLMPWRARLTFLADSPDEIEEAHRSMCRIGIDRPDRADIDRALDRLETDEYPVVDYAELASIPVAERTFRVLDVRRRGEFADGHLEEAVSIPLHELLDHLHHVPDGPLWVHCASGARASIAASLLARAHFDVTLVDGGPGADA